MINIQIHVLGTNGGEGVSCDPPPPKPFRLQACIQCNFHRQVTCYNVQIIHVVFLISFYDTPLPKEFLIWHYTVLSFGQMAKLIMIILALTALTLC